MHKTTVIGTLGTPFIASFSALDGHRVQGASVDWTKFSVLTVLPAGTFVQRGADGLKPVTANDDSPVFLTLGEVPKPTDGDTGARHTTGLVKGLEVLENHLPGNGLGLYTAEQAEQIAASGFTFVTDNGAAVREPAPEVG